MKFSYRKSLYIGLSALAIAGIGSTVTNGSINAKQRTRVVRINHLSKWRRGKINRFKLSKRQNTRKIKAIRRYVKHHRHNKRTKNMRRILTKLSRGNRSLNRQIKKLTLKKVRITRNQHKINKHIKRNDKPRVTISYTQLRQEMNHYPYSNTRQVNDNVRKIINQHVNVRVSGKTIPINNNNDVLRATKLNSRTTSYLISQQIQLNHYANQALENNTTPPSVEAQMATALDNQPHSASEYEDSNNPFNGMNSAQIRQAYQQKNNDLEHQLNSLQ